MAKRLSFYCDLCDKSYDFRSRYDRHLLSSTHRDLEGAIKLQNFSVPETQSDPCLLPSSTTESRSVSGIPVDREDDWEDTFAQAVAQCALFLLGPYMLPKEKLLWVFEIAYCQPFHYNKQEEYQQICQDFVNTVKENSPELLKIHLILHLVKSMCDFGPTSAFNAERIYNVVSLFCRRETLIRARNIYANRL